MEEILKVSILAFIQGITEFLPISSSGHLVISKHILNISDNDATLEIILHAGTLCSILIYYRNKLFELLSDILHQKQTSLAYIALLLISVFPASIIGLRYGANIEGELFSSPKLVSILLIITGVYLIISHFLKPLSLHLGKRSALIIGLSQAIALLPGISRSGFTIGTARLLGIDSKKAAEFSFLMAIPLLIGVIIYKAIRIFDSSDILNYSNSSLVIGFLFSAVIGYYALSWLVSLLQKEKFWYFGIYCLVIGCTYLSYLLL